MDRRSRLSLKLGGEEAVQDPPRPPQQRIPPPLQGGWHAGKASRIPTLSR
jgi:hypothetical protein